MTLTSTNTKWMGAIFCATVMLAGGQAQAKPTCAPTYTYDLAGDQVTLAANCTPDPGTSISETDGYNWTIEGGGPALPTTSTFPQTNVQANGKTYKTQARNPGDTYGVEATVTVPASASLTGYPSPCSLKIAAATLLDSVAIIRGDAVTLVPACQGAVALDWYAAVGAGAYFQILPPPGGMVFPVGDTKYKVVGANALGETASNEVSVTVGSSNPGVISPVCKLAASAINVTSGTPVTLTASCPGAETYAWSTAPATFATSNVTTVTPAVTTTYYVLGKNPAGTSSATAPEANATITVSVADTIPDAFSFTSQDNVAVNSAITSNTITVAGINAASAISIAGGTYSINGGAYTSAAGTVSVGNTVTVKLTSSASNSTLASATLTIGGVNGVFDVTTAAVGVDTTPDAFSFTAQTDVALSSEITSNTITVAGINASSAISIAGGTYSINGGAYTAAAGTVNVGNTVALKLTSSGSNATLTSATLTIGGVSGQFNATTLAGGPDGCQTTATVNENWSWAASYNSVTKAESLLPNQTLALRFTTGATGQGTFGNVETAGVPAAERYATISACPGDFATTAYGCVRNGSALSANVNFIVGGSKSGYCTLQPNTTYYFNIRHANPGVVPGTLVETCTFASGCAFFQSMTHN